MLESPDLRSVNSHIGFKAVGLVGLVSRRFRRGLVVYKGSRLEKNLSPGCSTPCSPPEKIGRIGLLGSGVCPWVLRSLGRGWGGGWLGARSKNRYRSARRLGHCE